MDDGFAGRQVFVAVGSTSGEAWVGTAINRRENFVCVNKGRQLVAGISELADLFERGLEPAGELGREGPK